MDFVNLLFVIGNFICLIGTCLLLRRVWRNRGMLKDFDFMGSLLTFIPIVIFCIAYIFMHNYFSLMFATVTLAFWGMATVFSGRRLLGNKDGG